MSEKTTDRYHREKWECPCGETFEFMCEVKDQNPIAVEFRCVKCSRVQLLRGRLLSASWKDGENWVSLTVT